ncbi:hypothetical protein AGDE_09913 [Angomonas deanei]|nr:hypothetical protein AGDE_09913 [Angomonas deanei]|eukprot:EPY29698.1 hypothetical protein AGDE_09913 [Angomonas deanei]
MSTAITLVGNSQVLFLNPARLIVGIRLQGTIGHINLNQPNYVRPRPYLHYLSKTLQKLNCDVTLFLPLAPSEQNREMIHMFSHRDFPIPFRVVYDHPSCYDNRHSPAVRSGLAPRDYTTFLTEVAQQKGSNGSRVLFLESEINYRFKTTQTLILEDYQPMTRRQQRQLFQKELEEQRMSVDRGTRTGAMSAAEVARQKEKEAFQHGATQYDQYTKLLEEEAERNRSQRGSSPDGLEDPQAVGRGGWLGRHTGPTMPVMEETEVVGTASDVMQRRAAERATAQSLATRAKLVTRGTAPFAVDSVEAHVVGKDEGPESAGADGTGPQEEEAPFSSPGTTRALAINMEDYTLIAVAEMLAELASGGSTVEDYLKYEPLVEKLNVPSHGVANYLPIENCDYIETLDWEKVEVREAKREEARRNTVEEVVETDEHKDFFQ